MNAPPSAEKRVKRFTWAISFGGKVAHIVYGKRFRVEGEPTACGLFTRVGWTWVAASHLKRWGARRCKHCENAT